MLHVLSLLTCLHAISGGVVHTSDFKPHWEIVPAPTQAPTVVSRQNGWANGLRPAGTYEIAYSLVDEQNRLTPPSPAVRITATVRDWQIAVDTPGLDPQTRAYATCWWFRPAGRQPASGAPPPWQPLGTLPGSQTPSQVTRPFVPIGAWQCHALQAHELYQAFGWNSYGHPLWGDPSPLAAPANAPSVRVLQVDNVDFQACYSWRCNDGETDLSPSVTIPAFVHPADPSYRGPSFHAPCELGRSVIPPQGALGLYLYLRPAGTKVWHRQPAPHGKSDLWALDLNRLPIRTFVPTGISPGRPVGRSWLSELHLALRDGNGADVIVDGDLSICCPVINAFSAVEGKTIGKINGGRWVLRDTGTVPDASAFSGYPRMWPLWIENAYNTRLNGCRMELIEAEGGIAFFDHVGGNAAGDFRASGVSIQLQGGDPHRNSYGVRCLWPSRGVANDHSASEAQFRDFHAAAKFPVVCEGNQSANWLFDVAVLTSNNDYDSAIITQGNQGSMTFANQTRADFSRCLLAATTTGRCSIQGLWIDQGMPVWLNSSAGGMRLTISGTKVNQWTGWLHACECAGAMYAVPASSIKVSDLDSQGPPTSALCCCPPGAMLPVVTQTDPVAILRSLAGSTVVRPAFRRRR